MKYQSLQERLVVLSVWSDQGFLTPCLLWNGYTQDKGYVSFRKGYGKINLSRDGRSLKFTVHRVARVLYEILTINPAFNFYDKEDKQSFFDLYDAYRFSGLTIDHLCKVSRCLNPLHLEWVYADPNQKRKKWSYSKRKARLFKIQARLTRHHRTVVTSNTVKELIRKIKAKSYRRA
jgi:hypothetical protein